jgi:hypothetical protein
MLSRPGNVAPSAISATPPKPRPETAPAPPVSSSRYAKPPGAHSAPKPTVLMGEVVGPRVKDTGKAETGKQREALRAFIIAHHLSPTQWARAAGVPAGEILAFLTGQSRAIAPRSLAKLAQAANCAPEDLLR